VLWHCWFGHLACKNRPRNDYYVSSGTLNLHTHCTHSLWHSIPIHHLCYYSRLLHIRGPHSAPAECSLLWLTGQIALAVHSAADRIQGVCRLLITQRRSVAKNVGCRRICLWICGFVCQHDNFRTSEHRMMKLGGRCIVKNLGGVRILGSTGS